METTYQWHSESIAKVAAALVKAQAEMPVVFKNEANPFYHSRYATFDSIVAETRPVLAKHKLAVIQRAHPCDAGIHIQTTLVHESGEWISDDGLVFPAAKQDPQGFASAMTYTKRYGYCAMLGVTTGDDDDGNKASGKDDEKPKARGKKEDTPPLDKDIVDDLMKNVGKEKPSDADRAYNHFWGCIGAVDSVTDLENLGVEIREQKLPESHRKKLADAYKRRLAELKG